MAGRDTASVFRGAMLGLLLLALLPLLTHATSISPLDDVLNVQVKPTLYELHIKPIYLPASDEFTGFDGTVAIEIYIDGVQDKFSLYVAKDMTFENITLVDSSGTEVYYSNYSNDAGDLLTLQGSFLTGAYKLYITYTGTFQDNMVGFYKSTYTAATDTGEEQTRTLLLSKFEPTHARAAFPCFDEPKYKAAFRVKVDVPLGYWALSNTEMIGHEPGDDLDSTTITFGETAKMSTYLVAFLVYENETFIETESVDLKSGTRLTSWGPKSKVESYLLHYSLYVSWHVVTDLETFTNINYNDGKMTKIDQAAIADFAAGAMENWGLTMYRDIRVYYDPEEDSEATAKSVAMVLAHELSHQWFGNLVTMEWWSHTWLNEGFARFFQYYLLQGIFPDWRIMEQLLVDQQHVIFSSDASAHVKSLVHDVTTYDEIRNGQFSSLTYSKGGSVLRMIYMWMGEENFQKAIQEYLSENAYANVLSEHLIQALDRNRPEEPALPAYVELKTAIYTWLDQSGFPVVTVERDYLANTVTFSQRRFFSGGPSNNDNTMYYIPLSWSSRTKSKQNHLWLYEDVRQEDKLYIDEWMLVHATSYCRVNYDEANWLTLALTLNRSPLDTIAAMDRARLVEDALALERAGYVPFSHVAPLLWYLKRETDALPWAAAMSHFATYDRLLSAVDGGAFYGFVRENIAAMYAKVGIREVSDHLDLVHQPNVVLWACRAGLAECRRDVDAISEAYLTQGAFPIKKHFRQTVVCYGIRENGVERWRRVWNVFRETQDATERTELLAALTCISNKDTLHSLLGSTLTGEVIKTDEIAGVFTNVNSNPEGLEVAIEFLKNRYSDLFKTVSIDAMNGILRNFGDRITRAEHVRDMKKFVELRLEEDLIEEAVADDVIARMNANTEWLRLYQNDAMTQFSKDILGPAANIPSTPAPVVPGGGGSSALRPLPALLAAGFVAWLLRRH